MGFRLIEPLWSLIVDIWGTVEGGWGVEVGVKGLGFPVLEAFRFLGLESKGCCCTPCSYYQSEALRLLRSKVNPQR